MDDLNPDEQRVVLAAIRAYERDHHAEYINKLSIITAKVWRRASERAVP